MKKPSLITLASLIANIAFMGALVHVYQTTSDTAFKAWVDQNILSTYTLILGAGAGGGSILAYILLGRKGSKMTFPGKPHPTSPQKQFPSLSRQGAISAQARNVPVGPPLGPASKHTAYAVPSLAKSPAASTQRQQGPYATAPRQWTPAAFRAAQQQPVEAQSPSVPTYPPQQSNLQLSRNIQGQSSGEASTFGQGRLPQFAKPAPANPIPPPQTSDRDGSQPWGLQAENQPSPERVNPQFPRQPTDNQPVPPYLRQPMGPPIDKSLGIPTGPTAPNPSQDTAGQQTSTDRSGYSSYSTPQKWLPPTASPVSRAQPTLGPTLRPNQQNESNPNPGTLGTPRPLGYAGPLRQHPMESPRFRPDQARSSGPEGPQIPPSSIGRPFPVQRVVLPESEPSQPKPHPEFARQPINPPQSAHPEEPHAPTDSNPMIGEMDWDTALDAILKTLRKDKVADKP